MQWSNSAHYTCSINIRPTVALKLRSHVQYNAFITDIINSKNKMKQLKMPQFISFHDNKVLTLNYFY